MADKNITQIIKTNYDTVINKSIEEMAEWLDTVDTVFWDKETWLKWLKKEADNG